MKLYHVLDGTSYLQNKLVPGHKQGRQAGSLAMANLTGNVFAAARTNINPARHTINQSILKNNLAKQGKACMQIKHMRILYRL
jgi:hypothetical protein